MAGGHTRELRIGLALLVGLGVLVFVLVAFGSPRNDPALEPIAVADVLAQGDPALFYGATEVRIVGWYAELAADCTGDDGGADETVAWLQADCPLRVLLPAQPPDGVSQAALEASGLRLAAPTGAPFPPRAQPGGANLQLQPLVFVGHFADPAASSCVPERESRCQSMFVVRTYTRLVR